MTDYTKLIEELQTVHRGHADEGVSTFSEAAEAIEALQGEVERLKTEGACWKQLHDEVVVERDALQAENETVLSQNKSALQYMDAAEAEHDALQAENERLKTGYLKIRVALGLDLHSTDNLIDVAQALKAKLDELQRQEPVKFLVDATRFKTTMLANGRVLINDLPLELAGRWVAFVAAENDCHLKLSAPKALEPDERKLVRNAALEEAAQKCKQLEVAIDGGGNTYYRPADARQCVSAIESLKEPTP